MAQTPQTPQTPQISLIGNSAGTPPVTGALMPFANASQNSQGQPNFGSDFGSSSLGSPANWPT